MTPLEAAAYALWANDVTDLSLEPNPSWTPEIRTHFMALVRPALLSLKGMDLDIFFQVTDRINANRPEYDREWATNAQEFFEATIDAILEEEMK